MGTFDDTICQLRDFGMSKAANIISDLERDNITLAGNNFKLREQLVSVAKDAERYRWLREQSWIDSPLCVVADQNKAVKLGYDCPSMERLDTAIDSALAKVGAGKTGEGS